MGEQSSEQDSFASVEIKNIDGIFEISSPHVELHSNKEPLKLELTLGKLSTSVEEGERIDYITVNREGKTMQSMLIEAGKLKDLPDLEKPRKVMEILKKRVRYAFGDIVDELAMVNPTLADWVSKNTGLESSFVSVNTSEIAESGYGICRHLAVMMLVLGKEAGLEGAFCTYSRVDDPSDALRNVNRVDTGKPLFRGNNPGEPIPSAHAWVELKTCDGDWVPVDPSTELVGDTPEGLETFRQAKYQAQIGAYVNIEGMKGSTSYSSLECMAFLPGEGSHTGVVNINARRFKGIRISLSDNKDEERESGEASYEGPLDLKIYSKNLYPDQVRGVKSSIDCVKRL